MSTDRATYPVLMDVDTGVDDAMALSLAVKSEAIALLGVTTVAGNVDLEQATRNTLRVLGVLGAAETPVYSGMSRPLSRAHFDAAHFHGVDGLGGAPFPEPQRQKEQMTAPEVIVQTARRYAGELCLICVGPLTNLAVALALEPALPDLVSRTVVMGGAFDVPGNTTPHAEFNIAVDPEAARIVAESDLRTTWIGLDVTHQTGLIRADWEALTGLSHDAGIVVREVCRQSFAEHEHDSVHLHDPLAVGTLIWPDVVRCEQSAIWVDTSIRETAGTTRLARDSRATQHNVALSVEAERFRNLFKEVLGLPNSESSSLTSE